jgi:hypothetical protein
MANKKLVVEVKSSIDPMGVEDLGFKMAGALATVKNLASWSLDNVEGFPSNVSPENVTAIRKGALHKYSLDHKPTEYVVIEDALHKVSDLIMSGIEIPSNAEKRNIGVDYAFSFSSVEAGKLKDNESEPKNLYGIVKQIRNDANKYTSNCFNKLVAEGIIQDNLRKGVKAERKANLDFFEFLYDKEKGVLATMQTRCKNAKAKGDVTADEKKLSKAIVAFNVAFKHKE